MVVKNSIESILGKETRAAPEMAEKPQQYQALKSGSKRAAAFGLSALGIGAYDAFHPRSWNSYFVKAGNWLGKYVPKFAQFLLPITSQLYQVLLVTGSVIASALTLHNKKWSKKRNLSNLMTVPANAVAGDYASAAMAAKKPLLYPIPQADYGWRIKAFKSTAWGGLAHLINSPSFIPGILTGYLIGFLSLGAYFGVQAAYLLYKNYAKVKAWTKSTGTKIYNGIDRASALLKNKAIGGYMYLTDKLKTGYAYMADKVKGFAHKIAHKVPTINPTYINPDYHGLFLNLG